MAKISVLEMAEKERTLWERLEKRRQRKLEAPNRYRETRQVWERSPAGVSHSLKKRYGITFEDRAALLVEQGGKCGNLWCSQRLSFEREDVHKPYAGQMDHDHTTDKLRGILCRNCNLALGLLYDSPERLQGLAAYILRCG